MTPEAQKEYKRKWAAANPDKVKGYSRKWDAAHRAERAQRARDDRARNPEKKRKTVLKWRDRNKARYAELKRKWRLRAEYGMTPEQFDFLMDLQDCGCGVCKTKTARRLVVDHCHNSGKVRGLLCDNCNWLIGHARDNPHTLESAAAYLRKHQK